MPNFSQYRHLLRRNLFSRIFLWLVTSHLIIGCLVYFAAVEIVGKEILSDYAQLSEGYATAVVTIYGKGQLDESITAEDDHTAKLKQWLTDINQTAELEIYISTLDQSPDFSGEDILGRMLPNNLPQSDSPEYHHLRRAGKHYQAVIVDEHMVMILEREQLRFVFVYPESLTPAYNMEFLAYRLVITFTVIGLISMLLAYLVTKPFEQLRGAVKRFAEGQLHSRAPTSVSHRGDQYGELAKEFNLMAERIEALVESHQQLLRDVSHELRSPLARLQMALELARHNHSEVELERIEKEAMMLDNLIGEVLFLARLDAKIDSVDEDFIDLAKIIMTIVDDANFEKNDVTTTAVYHGLERCMIRGNKRLIQSAVENVVRNAMRYTRKSSQVDVFLDVRTDDIKITVCDEGQGVSPQQIGKIFDPFYRVDGARQRGSGGFGVGLAIADRAIRMHHGSISALNRPTVGLQIEITLPNNH